MPLLDELIASANGAPLPVGPRNIREKYPSQPAMIREILSCEWRQKKDGRWLWYTWSPRQDDPKTRDCGYSGIRADHLASYLDFMGD